MQETRRQILQILRDIKQATITEIVANLRTIRQDNITPVTVRHHLNVLQSDGYVTANQNRDRETPGRPQHIYELTDYGWGQFPNNFKNLANNLAHQLQRELPEPQVNVIFEGVADMMAAQANIINTPNATIAERLDSVVDYLSSQGYDASWQAADKGFELTTSNCPYHAQAHDNDHLCTMDMHLIAKLLGIVPRRTSRIAAGDEACVYFIPYTPK